MPDAMYLPMFTTWYSVVTFGSPTTYTIAMLGDPTRIGSRVTRDLNEAGRRARALSQGHVSGCRILTCPTRDGARGASIADSYPVEAVYV